MDFDFTCVYCLSHEAEVGSGAAFGGFEIEHFRPKSLRRELRHRYDNLLWACRACNLAKGGTWPSLELEQAGYRFVDPSREGLGKHIELAGYDQVAPKTAAGSYVVKKLDLNSTLHTFRRRERNEKIRRLETVRATLDALDKKAAAIPDAETLSEIGGLIVELRRELEVLEASVYPQLPWDPPASCLCGSNPGRIPRYT